VTDAAAKAHPEAYAAARSSLEASPRTWVVTGAAGFIGSNLVEALLGLGQRVRAVDNFQTGRSQNIEEATRDNDAPENFRFVEGDVADLETMRAICTGADVLLHQAALGSVPRSIADPAATNRANVDGFLETLVAAKEAGIRRVVYASSSSVYGDDPRLPKTEENVGRPLSPYAVTKLANELYANVFARTYGMETVGLRYFNVFGKRQDPEGPYAAVIPRWIRNLLSGEPCEIFGDGETSRDFCYIENAVQANILAALAPPERAAGAVFNVAVGEQMTLNELFRLIRDKLAESDPELHDRQPVYRPFRPGDIRRSLADIGSVRAALGYAPSHSARQGLAEWLPTAVAELRELRSV
jgi:UDP-N-acetylglucosamine 4-epimerase